MAARRSANARPTLGSMQQLSSRVLSFRARGGAALSAQEADLEDQVGELLNEAVELGPSGRAFGLKWRYGSADEPRVLTGGWMFQVSKDVLSLRKKKRGKLAFFILDDENGCLRQCKDETGTYTYRYVDFRNIMAVRACYSEPSDIVYVKVYLRRAKGADWLLMPVQGKNEEIVVRWVAALRERVGLLTPEMEARKAAAQRIALWAQSLVRMRRAVEKAERRRERRRGLLNRMSALVYGVEDSDSDGDSDDDDDDDEPEPAPGARGTGGPRGGNGPFLAMFVTALAQDIYEHTFLAQASEQLRQQQAQAAMQSGPGANNQLFKKRSIFKPISRGGVVPPPPNVAAPVGARPARLLAVKRSETYVQDSLAVPPLQGREIEDELWENERWQLGPRWAKRSLLPTDRAPFSDRLGRGGFQAPSEWEVPEGWTVTSDWRVDLSGQVEGTSGVDGFTYALDFPPLDSDHARGIPKTSKSLRTAVRRRRWFRRRVPSQPSRVESFVIWHGWLGCPSASSGRWRSRYFVLTRGLRLHGKVTGVALSYFRFDFADHLDVLSRNDLEVWNSLSTKELRTFNLDGALVLGITKPHPAKSRYFEVRIASKQAPLQFVADSEDACINWKAAIEHSVKDQLHRFTLTKSLDLGRAGPFSDVQQYDNAVLDRLLPLRPSAAFDLLLFNPTFEAAFAKACGYKESENEPWSQAKNAGSRRRIVYLVPKRHETLIIKQKVVRREHDEAYQVDMSLQRPEVPWGNIFQDEVRIVLSNWKDKNTRVCITHRVQLRSEDEEVRAYVESSARKHILDIFIENWLPLVTRTLKERHRREQEKGRQQLSLTSPSGIAYRLDPNKKAIQADGYAY